MQTAGVSALLVKGNFIFDSANHRDFLGACLGTGIDRSKVGDILVQGEQGASILVVPDMVSHLEMNLTSVCTPKGCVIACGSSTFHVVRHLAHSTQQLDFSFVSSHAHLTGMLKSRTSAD